MTEFRAGFIFGFAAGAVAMVVMALFAVRNEANKHHHGEETK